ncbi:PA14 domain-containing protein [Flagellimonas halotolerans]|uniref:PA14 domain-containing protein n=1 Tax=Flagellimonas halotolerans TaxID=3112164 RepID=A0ABU6IMD9_9FLAO|nr:MULTISPECIES: PA14 domain-containing protein [unclassified Allomuricauda]MEC3964407.1 PA14 domain-containing protein [Muricauda sp. SYSU M86414]MEC4264277.1 PA14 domain-containing protein [Muricauda sp. SYSU M84420]
MGTTSFFDKKMNHFPNGWMLIIAFFLLGTFLSFSQTTIWSESFSYPDETSNGTATGPSNTNWSSNNPGRLRVIDNGLEGKNLGTESIFQTGPINIYGYTAVDFSMNATVFQANRFENSDYFIGEYRIDGGSWVKFEDASGATSDPLDTSYTVNLPSTGSTLEIRVRMYNDSGNERYYLDNLTVNGVLDLCNGEIDFEFYDSAPSGYTTDNIPTTGYQGAGTFTSFNVDALQNQEDPGDADDFSIRYSGYIQIDTEGSYTFFTSSDDGSKLFIDGTEVVDNDGNHGTQERSGNISLTTGLHDITILFFENGGGETLNVQYQGPSLSKQNVPFSKLYSNCSVDDTFEDNEPPSITATGDQIYCPGDTISVVESIDISDADSSTLDGVYVQVTSNYDVSGDVLSLTGTHPNITASYDTSEGRLFLEGPATLAEFEAAIGAVVFQTTATVSSGDTRTFSIVMNETNYLESTGHYYEYVPSIGITWTAARDAAALRTFYGLQGYLATISSQDESDLLGSQAPGAGWIGASDATTEGDWYWVTGPEAGTLFWRGTRGGTAFGYEYWNSGEPNQSGDEDYAHITAPGVGLPGSWNDLSNTGAASGDYQPKGYLVEYGGMPGDPTHPDLAATTMITVETTAPTASAPDPIAVNCSADIPTPDVTVITDEADDCDPNPTVTFVSEVSDGGSKPEIITRTYRITDRAGNTTDVEQTITITPFTISSQPTDQTVVMGNNGGFSVTAINVDTYQWEVSTDGGSNFTPIMDGTEYSGTQTANLSVNSPDTSKNGYIFRVLASNSTGSCNPITSDEASLTVKTGRVITNRGVTYRVNSN